jgi:Domain of unknown function (DUF1844)
LRVCYTGDMADPDAEEGFRVRDRRRRAEDEEVPVPEPAAPPPASPPPEATPPPERSLVGLFAMLASVALASLEGVPDPATGRTHRDPEQAAEIVDVLMLLREKTEGRRTPEESQMLDALIYDLQVRYVQAKRPG